MDLRVRILSEHSSANTLFITNWIGNDINRFDALMQLFLLDTQLVVQRSAWVLGKVSDIYPHFINPYLHQILERCQQENIHVAAKRNVCRLLQSIEIPIEHQEEILNFCFEFLLDQKETVAVRCFAMGTLCRLCKIYPEIKNELKCIIEDALEQQEITAGFKSKARKVLSLIKE